MNTHLFQGTGKVTKVLFRQHRIKIGMWLVGLVGLSLAVALAYPEIFQTQEDVTGFGATMQNPAMIAMLGPAYELGEYTIGTIFAAEMLLFSSIAVAVMNILLVSSSTRLDEEEGRLEMMRALPVGRLAYLSASILMVFIVNAVLFLFLSSGLGFFGHESMTWEASFLYGAALTATGMFFAGVTALSAQMAATSRGTTGISLALLLVSYMIRAVGDVGNDTLSLFSPLGWTVRTSVFVKNHWWPISALLGGCVLFIGAAFYFNKKRDILAGILPTRKGKVHASVFLKRLPGFVWRLEKNTVIAWGIGLFLIGLVSGAVLGDIETYFSDLEIFQQYLTSGPDAASMIDQFIVLVIGIMSIFASAPALSVLLSLAKEERLVRAEHFYSRSVSRNRVLGSYYGLAFLTSVTMQALLALGLYLSSSQVMEDSMDLPTFLSASLVYLPAVWVTLGLAAFLIGWFPKAAKSIWLYVLLAFLILYLSVLLEFPEWVNALSAFHHVPEVPVESMEWLPLMALSGIAAALSLAGFIGYNKRDIQG